MSEKRIFREESLVMAASCWQREETSHCVMQPEVAEVVADLIENWMHTAAQHHRNEQYYKHLVEQCGEIIGEESYIADDGGKHQDVLCAKVPELVRNLKDRLDD